MEDVYEGAEELTLDELYALHARMDEQVTKNRSAMGALHKYIVKREQEARTPGDPALTQGVRWGS